MLCLQVCVSLLNMIISVLTEEAGSGGNVDTERKAAVKTIPTLGHQPVILGGLYSAVEDEFLPEGVFRAAKRPLPPFGAASPFCEPNEL